MLYQGKRIAAETITDYVLKRGSTVSLYANIDLCGGQLIEPQLETIERSKPWKMSEPIRETSLMDDQEKTRGQRDNR